MGPPRNGTPCDESLIGGSFTKQPVLFRSASRVDLNALSPYPYHSFRVLLEVE
ncbi:MAG: hypothetical protein AAGI37_08320 [Planctomycetota bacterium]